jgi:branched-chain amino acid transport system permease protein
MKKSPRTTLPDALRRSIGALPWIAACGVLAYAFAFGGYLTTVMSFALIYAIFVTGLNVFMGFAGQVSFGHNAFAALSGYASAVLTASHGWAPLPAFGIGLALALLCAAIVGYPTLRLRGHYLAMATLAVGLIVYEVAVEWKAVTQGYMGISGIPPLGVAGFEVTSERGQLALLTVIVALVLGAAWRIRESRFGRALAAIAGSEDAARALGIAAARYKLTAFLASAAFAALAGSLFVHVVGFVSPEVYGLHMVVLTFTMLYVGGIGTIAGPFVGAIVISLLPELLRRFKDYQDLVYGVALILLLIYAPKGLSAVRGLVRGSRAAAAPQ